MTSPGTPPCTGGTVDDVTLAQTAESMRMLLDAVAAGRISSPRSSRHRLEGIVIALEAMAAQRP